MTEWTDHLQSVRNKNPGKSLKECMQIASTTYKKSGASKSSSKDHSKSSKKEGTTKDKKLQKNVEKELRDIVGYSEDLMLVPDMISTEHFKLLKNACKKVHAIHESLREEEEEDEESSDEDSDDSDSD
tara:strand:+ start:452 stop:835 length:384 start_codon:yes stop_codon:yes gene_type:complete